MHNDYDCCSRDKCDGRQRANYLLPRIVWKQEARAAAVQVALSGISLPEGCACGVTLRAVEARCAYAIGEISEVCGGSEICFGIPVCLRVCANTGREQTLYGFASVCMKIGRQRAPISGCTEIAVIPHFRLNNPAEICGACAEVCMSVCAEVFALKYEPILCACGPKQPNCPELPLYPQLPMPDVCGCIPQSPHSCAACKCGNNCGSCDAASRPKPIRQGYTGCLREFFK
jgi:hypothetical protein